MSQLRRWHSILLTGWNNYRVSADANNGAKALTNLALKGIIGIKAMSDISAVMGIDDDTQHYSVSHQPFSLRTFF